MKEQRESAQESIGNDRNNLKDGGNEQKTLGARSEGKASTDGP